MEPKSTFSLIILPLLLSYTLTITSLTPPPTISPTPSPSKPTPSSPSNPTPSPFKPTPSSPSNPTPSPFKPSPSSPSKPTPSPFKPTPSSPSKPTPSSPTTTSTLDPKQITALQSLDIPTLKDPCSQPSPKNATLCDSATPFRHLVSLHLINCSDDTRMSPTALKSLATLHDLSFINCPIPIVRFPSDLAGNLDSFTCINSLRKLTGVWLSRLQNVTDLTVSDTGVNASGPSIILGSMKKLRTIRISRTNLTGYLPKRFHSNISSIDLSGNELRGQVPNSVTRLLGLEFLNLSSNGLTGLIPPSIGDLLSLRNVSFASNSMSGPVPDSLFDIPSLVHLDLSSNQFNGTVPKFFAEMKNLKHLNLENNNFHGVMPFNGSFIKRLAVFKVGGNNNLCYNHSIVSSKLKLGIAPCDRDGYPVSPPPDRSSDSSSGGDDSSDDSDDDNVGESSHRDDHHHGPSKIVLAVAIGLACLVFLIIFLVLISKWCR